MAIRQRHWMAVTVLVAFCAMYLWILFNPSEGEEVGFQNEDPEYLFGCYTYGGSQIILGAETARFGDQETEISYGMRKTLREVIYPRDYPWFNDSTGVFEFQNESLSLVDLIQDDDGTWTIQIWKSNYLDSNDPRDLDTVYFRNADCVG